jgi:hypothetical protein
MNKLPWWEGYQRETGDNIQISIGDNASHIVAGKNIVAFVRESLGEPTSDDLKKIREELLQLRHQVIQMEATEATKAVASYNIELLESELTQSDKIPDQKIIRKS